MRRGRALAVAALTAVSTVVVMLVALPGRAETPAAPEPPPPPNAATVNDASPLVRTARYPVYDAASSHVRDALWRVTDVGGSCCGVYVAATPDGRLLEYGGSRLHFSDDRGQTWKYVFPLYVQELDGEGAVLPAPNGDVIGVGWDAQSADRLVVNRYVAATGAWTVTQVPLHEPLHARPLLTVVPGPWARADGTTAPYAVVVRSGLWAANRTDVFLVSDDDETFVPATDEADALLGATVTTYLEPRTDPVLDYLQPNASMRTTPLARGGMLHLGPAPAPSCPATRYIDSAWECVSVPGHTLGPSMVVDSRGWLHEAARTAYGIAYRVSPDGGRTWDETLLTLPEGGVLLDSQVLDYKANGALGIAAVSVKLDHGTSRSENVVYKLDVSTPTPRLVERMSVGAGDRFSSDSLTWQGNRFDYSSVAILPDGKLAVSFDDTTSDAPQLAIELDDPAEPTPSPTPSATESVSPSAPASPSETPSPSPSETVTASPSPDATPSETVTASPTPTATPAPPADTTAPAASMTAPRRLTDPVAVRFDEPVNGVTASNVLLRLASGSTVPAATSCLDGTAAVACTGTVTGVVLRPAPLRPGERYAVVVNPPGVAPAHDAAGNAAIATTLPFRASVAEEETSVAARYTWRTVSDSAAYGASYVVDDRAGARAAWGFSGRSITWYGASGPAFGRVELYVDGTDRGTVDTYAPSARWRVPHRIDGLSPGPHRLVLRVRGDRARASRGNAVVLDAVTNVANPAWSATWAFAPLPGFSGGAAACADLAGAQVSFTFRGTGVDWVSAVGPAMGRAAIYVDGRLRAVVDGYAPTARYGVRRAVTGLSDATHTVVVRVLGTRSSASSGTLVVVDRWLVR